MSLPTAYVNLPGVSARRTFLPTANLGQRANYRQLYQSGLSTLHSEEVDPIGVDAALDYPLFYNLTGVARGILAPDTITQTFETRKQVARDSLSSYGEATNFFVTFLDNHDQNSRFYYRDPANPHAFDDQLALAVACLFALPGIPCLYYGTEQGLSGSGNAPEAVREACGASRVHSTRTGFLPCNSTACHSSEESTGSAVRSLLLPPLIGQRHAVRHFHYCSRRTGFLTHFKRPGTVDCRQH